MADCTGLQPCEIRLRYDEQQVELCTLRTILSDLLCAVEAQDVSIHLDLTDDLISAINDAKSWLSRPHHGVSGSK